MLFDWQRELFNCLRKTIDQSLIKFPFWDWITGTTIAAAARVAIQLIDLKNFSSSFRVCISMGQPIEWLPHDGY
jgi:hypothetical protein